MVQDLNPQGFAGEDGLQQGGDIGGAATLRLVGGEAVLADQLDVVYRDAGGLRPGRWGRPGEGRARLQSWRSCRRDGSAWVSSSLLDSRATSLNSGN
jgi:hypothetical protein